MSTRLAFAVLVALTAAAPVVAQQPTPSPAAPAPAATPAAAPAPAAAAPAATSAPAAPAKAAAPAKKCMRLPLSDVAFGKEGATAAARVKLDEYAAEEAKKRGWGPTVKSLETVSCTVYLDLPILGTEYQCLVTATFCAK